MEQELRVDKDGTAIFPLIGKVKIGGMTIGEARKFLYDLYNRDYFVNPQINLLVLEFAPRQVQVLGQVNTPGPITIPVDRQLSLVEAIALAGGQTRLANLRKVTVRRPAEEEESPETFELDVQQMITDQESVEFILKHGDIIFIPERTF